MADHPLRPATRLSLGEPLPHQLADRTRTLPEVLACRSRGHLLPQGANPSWSYPVLARLSTGYPSLQGRLSTCYSPGRRFTRRIAPTFSHDLHVSGTPPAFVLSQDQTLQLNDRRKNRSLFFLISVGRAEVPRPNCCWPVTLAFLLFSFQRPISFGEPLFKY